MGFPVREIATSCNPRRDTKEPLRAFGALLTARNVLETSEIQHFCIAMCWTIGSDGTLGIICLARSLLWAL